MAGLNTTVPETLNDQIQQLSSQNTEPKSVYVTTNAASTSIGIANPLCEHNGTPELVNQSFNITLKFISPAASSGPFCRICHEGDASEDLVSICKCSGSVGLVHITCLERWLSSRRSATSIDRCEICHHIFETIRYPKSLTEYQKLGDCYVVTWYQSEQGPTAARHSVLGDIACFSLITPLAAVSTFLCIQGAKRHVLWNNSLEAGCLMAVATFLVTVYLVWNILTIRYHLRSYYKWRSINQNVRLVRYRRTSTTDEDYHPTDIGRSVLSPDSRIEESANNQRVTPQQDRSLSRENFTDSVLSHLHYGLYYNVI